MTKGKKTIFQGLILLLLSNNLIAEEATHPFIDSLDFERGLKSAILKNKTVADQLEYSLTEGCERLAKTGVIEFIENQLSPIVKERPEYCEYIKKRGYKKDVAINMPVEGFSKATIGREFQIDFEEVYFDDSHATNERNKTSPTENFILKVLNSSKVKSLSRPLLAQDQEKTNLEDYEKKYIDAYRGRDRADPILKQTMLLRIWPELSSLEQMKILTECSKNYQMKLNNHKAFWIFNDQKKPENKNLFEKALKICRTEKTEELIPFIDESILNEYAYYLQGTATSSKNLFSLCHSWPVASFNNQAHLPSTNRKAVLLNFAEFQLSDFYRSDGAAIELFNDEFSLNISAEEMNAVRSYTGHSFNPLNAYEQWGKLGLYFATRERQQKISNNKRKKYKEPQYQDFENLEEYKEAYNKYQLHLKIGDIPLSWEHMTSEQKARHIQDVTLSYDESIAGQNIPEMAKNLKSALKSMDNFQGLSFGGHQLNTHIFKRLRKGSTFTPGFFMSTSTNINTAQGFLKISEDDSEDDLDKKTGYLFVLKNETGIPIVNQSSYPGEFEVLVSPDSQFKVLEIAPLEVDGKTYPNISIVFIQEID